MAGTEITKRGILTGISLTMLYDVIAYFAWGNDATISKVLLDSGEIAKPLTLIVTLAFGVLIGHWFLPQHVEKEGENAQQVSVN